jgi:diguanylate cyclase (GGDEF)-like protein
MAHELNPHPQVLVVSDGEWAGRSFESVLQSYGYSVQRASRGLEALNFVRRVSTDALIVEELLQDMSGTELCRLLRREPSIGAITPVVVSTAGPATPRDRAAAYAAGAWEYCSQPIDIEVLLLKLGTFVAARRELERFRDMTQVDGSTGLYNLRGMRRWSRELTARALRSHEPLACLALAMRAISRGPVAMDDDGRMLADEHVGQIARVVALQRRASDIVGYLGDGVFAILAPETGPTGAAQLADRLCLAAHDLAVSLSSEDHSGLNIGYWAVADFARAHATGEELLNRATAALDHARTWNGGKSVHRFEEPET